MTTTWTPLTRTAWGFTLGTDERDWLSQAACSPDVADWFWLFGHGSNGKGKRLPKLSADNRAAIALCRACPVIGDCLAYELSNPDPWPRIAAGRVWPEGVEPA